MLERCLRRFWFFKYAIVVGIAVGAFFIPGNEFATGTWITFSVRTSR